MNEFIWQFTGGAVLIICTAYYFSKKEESEEKKKDAINRRLDQIQSDLNKIKAKLGD